MPTTPTKGGHGEGAGGGLPPSSRLRPPCPAIPSGGAYLLDKKPTRGIPNHGGLGAGNRPPSVGPGTSASHGNSIGSHSNSGPRSPFPSGEGVEGRWRRFIQIPALSTLDGSIEDYHGYNGNSKLLEV